MDLRKLEDLRYWTARSKRFHMPRHERFNQSQITMTKTEILAALRANGTFDNNQRTDLWIQAFDAFNAAPENKGNRVSFSCGSCWTQVRNWLKRG